MFDLWPQLISINCLFISIALFSSIVLLILQAHLSTRMYAVWSSAVRNFTPKKFTWLWFPDHFAFFLVHNFSEKWCLSVEFLPFQLTRQCRGGPLESRLLVATLAILSHREPAKQGQGSQREKQPTIRYFAACQVFFHVSGVSSWLRQKLPCSQTWNLSKILHDQIFAPQIVHPKNGYITTFPHNKIG